MRIFAGSWNVNGKHPDKDMAPWLLGRAAGAAAAEPGEAETALPEVSQLADIIVIG